MIGRLNLSLTKRRPRTGIRLKNRVTRVLSCKFRRRVKVISRTFNHWLTKIRQLSLSRSFASMLGLGSGYMRLTEKENRAWEKRVSSVPKGHLVVYLKDEGGTLERVMVPIIYINHPLFEKLLRHSKEKYGFEYPGGITIPSPASEFEMVKTRIDSGRIHNGSISHKRGYYL